MIRTLMTLIERVSDTGSLPTAILVSRDPIAVA